MQWVPGKFPGGKRQSYGVEHPPLLAPKLSTGRAIPVPPLSACLVCYGTAFTFTCKYGFHISTKQVTVIVNKYAV
jgi:hypothetical protein